MKKRSIHLATLLFVIAMMMMQQSCLKDSATKTYTIYTPVYKAKAEVIAGIKTNAPRPVVHPGKLFIRDHYIFLNEIDKGIHVIDNSNPSSPVNKYFIPIPGNVDLAVKGNILYADLYRDLITIDISQPNTIQVTKVIDKVFPQRVYTNGFRQDTTRVIVDWIQKDTTVDINTNELYYFAQNAFLLSSQSGTVSNTSPTVGIGGSMARFALLNNYLYTVTDRELNVFNIAQPASPIFSNTVQIGWRIETIYPFSNKLFIGSQSGMFIYNTTDPMHPSYVSQFSHMTVCDPVIADNNYAYITLRTGTTCVGTINELNILDIQDLQNPTLVNTYQLTNPHGLAKSGNTLFICDGSAGLKVFKTSNLQQLELVQTIEGLTTYDVIAINNIALVVAADGLYQYDYSNPSKLILKSKIGY